MMARTLIQPKKVFRMHNSLTVTLPVGLLPLLDIKAGDFVLFEWKAHGKKAVVTKLKGGLLRDR